MLSRRVGLSAVGSARPNRLAASLNIDRGMAYRKHPRTGAKREVVQKYRAINEKHESMAAALDLPFRTVVST